MEFTIYIETTNDYNRTQVQEAIEAAFVIAIKSLKMAEESEILTITEEVFDNGIVVDQDH